MPARTAGAGRVHGGPVRSVSAGDDRLAVQVVALPGFDVAEEVFVELTMTPAGAGPTSLLLCGEEVDRLVLALAAARAVTRG